MLTKTASALILALSLIVCSVNAQNFTFICEDPTQPAVAGVENYFEALLTNTSNDDYNFVVEIDTTGIGDWAYFWCSEAQCYPPWVFSDTLFLPALWDTLFTVHITPNEPPPDMGGVVLTAYPELSPANTVVIDILAHFGAGIEGETSLDTPIDFALTPAFPNPFNPETSFSFRNARLEDVKISVFNLLGQEVRSLFEGLVPPGNHRFTWNGRDDAGVDQAAALYFIRIDNGQSVETLKTLKLK
ncbi:hypothetical protein CEE37_07705 [candidate division LCP-89 bacterium B3_LCP]|uniref:FlgD/Vpr Ig-like domain-containing protein n=1 Tax=candidate division LCP-89 bacterium B3_LCP TaxID=2012998 RepID=A0A532V0Z9_UNCL8|nr:MAG: hypothetical protein CEE37_07705 [candidate division LCP-89 bacterium B3_LCP]